MIPFHAVISEETIVTQVNRICQTDIVCLKLQVFQWRDHKGRAHCYVEICLLQTLLYCLPFGFLRC